MFKIIFISVTVVIAAILILAATRPDSFRVQRTVSIKAPPGKIFPLIDNLHDNARWQPYYMKDPAMKSTYSGPESGPGAQVDFDGDKNVGTGRVTITGHTPPDMVTMRLQMFKPFAGDNVVEFILVPKGEMTEVSWSMQGKMPYVARIISLFFNMDKMVGGDFETGLANLKTLTEK
ncbi:MAG: SRPBCC family protein [Stenotrophobium sp.]